MHSLYLSDILKRNGLDLKKVKLVRHSLNDKEFQICYIEGYMEEYQKIQKGGFLNNCDYVLTFVSGPGTSAKFVGCYVAGVGIPIESKMMPNNFPFPYMYMEKRYYFDLKESELLSDLKDRLIIDWGRGTINWQQWAFNEKAVLAIQEKPKFTFSGYENVILSYLELKEIIEDPTLYGNWHTALSSVYAIYLIADLIDGKQYIGSAYGSNGLLNRWKYYVESKHGENLGIKELLSEFPDRYNYFQFSILQILPKTITSDEVISFENLHKSKLLTKEFGLNKN